MLRNTRRARWLHTLVYLSTVFLVYSGIAVFVEEGTPWLVRVLGGHVTTAASHRYVGYGLLAAAALIALVWWRAAARFLGESVHFRAGELRWFAGYHRLALTRQQAPPSHQGHFDPGQRLFNLLLLLSFLVLGVTGIVMGMPERFVPAVFGWSLRIHRLATWALLVLVGGHLLVVSGLLPGYRGVWRAMHLDGRVPRATARRIWPRWADHETFRSAGGQGPTTGGSGPPSGT